MVRRTTMERAVHDRTDVIAHPVRDLTGDATASGIHRASALLIRLPEAARITGLPVSLLRKSFMREDKRPKNIPSPPPHKRIGRAVYVLASELPAWVENLSKRPGGMQREEKNRRGRPTVVERTMRRAV
jgi:hypothetical protein